MLGKLNCVPTGRGMGVGWVGGDSHLCSSRGVIVARTGAGPRAMEGDGLLVDGSKDGDHGGVCVCVCVGGGGASTLST